MKPNNAPIRYTTRCSRGPFYVSYHVVRFLAEPEEPRGLPARPGGITAVWRRHKTDKGSYPLGDSDAPSALRYAQAGRAQDQWGTDLVTVGIEVKKK